MNVTYLIKPTDTDEWEQTNDSEIAQSHLNSGADVLVVLVGMVSRVTAILHDSMVLDPIPEAKFVGTYGSER